MKACRGTLCLVVFTVAILVAVGVPTHVMVGHGDGHYTDAVCAACMVLFHGGDSAIQFAVPAADQVGQETFLPSSVVSATRIVLASEPSRAPPASLA